MDEARIREIVWEEIGAKCGQSVSPAEVEAIYQDVYGARLAAEVAPSYRFKIDDEAVPALWDGLRRELEVLVTPNHLPDAVENALRDMFFSVLANLGQHVFEGVALPADGAGKAILGFRVSGALQRMLARCAEDLLATTGHVPTPEEVSVCT